MEIIEIEREEITVQCNEEYCEEYGVPKTILAPTTVPWGGVFCGGSCGGHIHLGNEIEPIPEPTLEEKIAQEVEAALRSHGLID